jgi:hypothetical protein
LLAAWCDGSISKAEAERLDKLVCTDAEFRSFFRAYMDLHGLLAAEVHIFAGQLLAEPPGRSDADEGSQDVDGGAAARRPTGEIRRKLTAWHRLAGVSWPWRVGIAAAAVVLIGLTVLLWPKGRRTAPVAFRPPPPIAPMTALDGLAMAIHLEGVQWEREDGPPPAVGDVLTPRRLRMRSGRATLAFFNGAILTLEGPADVDLIAVDRVYCREGRLRVRASEGAKGFIVASAATAVVDLGTEFALNSNPDGGAHIRVFEGKVDAALLDAVGAPKRAQLVVQSKEFALDPRTNRIAETGAGPGKFVPAPTLAVSSLDLGPGYADAVLRSRPRGYWRFESLVDGVVSNEVPGGPPLRVGGPISIARGPGGNGCAVFRPGAPEQFLTTDTLWELARDPGHAVELWFQTDGFSYASLVGLYPPPEQGAQYLHTLLVELTGPRQFFHKPASIRFLHRWPIDYMIQFNIFSEHYYLPRRWHHIVAQKVGDQMDLYFDGVPDRTMAIEPDYPTLACQLVVGRRTPEASNPHDSRSFVGRLDELAIYDHPLSAEEVRHHYGLASQKVLPE